MGRIKALIIAAAFFVPAVILASPSSDRIVAKVNDSLVRKRSAGSIRRHDGATCAAEEGGA